MVLLTLGSWGAFSFFSKKPSVERKTRACEVIFLGSGEFMKIRVMAVPGVGGRSVVEWRN